MSALEEVIARLGRMKTGRKLWDFSREKEQPIFVSDSVVTLRPVNAGDVDFYIAVRTQYSMIYRVIIGTKRHSSESLFLTDLCQPESFYCIIEDATRTPIGYLGIKGTGEEVWELAIELDGKHTHQGYGSHSIRLFLNEISQITGRTVFRATVEADNVPSQRCFERLGAELVGLCHGEILRTPEEKARFEENNLNLIDDNIRALAERLAVEPRKLLSHLLEYRIACPL